jgi:hypothetical protein
MKNILKVEHSEDEMFMLVDGKVYRAHETDDSFDCTGCAFDGEGSDCAFDNCKGGVYSKCCSVNGRDEDSDVDDVIWKRYNKDDHPFRYQTLKTTKRKVKTVRMSEEQQELIDILLG